MEKYCNKNSINCASNVSKIEYAQIQRLCVKMYVHLGDKKFYMKFDV